MPRSSRSTTRRSCVRLPVPAPERLAQIPSAWSLERTHVYEQHGASRGRVQLSAVPRFLERDQRGFTTLAGFLESATNAWYKNQATRETGCLVSVVHFPTLGLKPTLGRLLGPADDAERASGFVVVVSHRSWRNRLAADLGV